MSGSLKTVLLCAIISCCAAQDVNRPRINPQINLLTSIPGFPLGSGTRNSKITVDLYIDLVCPDSEAAYPVLQEVVASYPAEDVSVYIHNLPLPYHRNAFLLTQGYFQTLEKAPETVEDYVSMCFNNIPTFKGSTNKNKTEWEMTVTLADLQEAVTGIPSEEFIRDNDDYSSAARKEWKYGVRRGVAGTPWLFVNDVDLGVNPNDFVDFNTWKIILDVILYQHDQSLSEQDVNLDDILYRQTKALSGVSTEERARVAGEASRYLREILRDNYFPVHSKKTVNNAHDAPQFKP